MTGLDGLQSVAATASGRVMESGRAVPAVVRTAPPGVVVRRWMGGRHPPAVVYALTGGRAWRHSAADVRGSPATVHQFERRRPYAMHTVHHASDVSAHEDSPPHPHHRSTVGVASMILASYRP